jgi:hypothetical protein
MNARLIRGILLASLCSAATVVCAGSTAKERAGWQTYRSPDFGFAIDYPGNMTFYPSHPVEPPELSMFPICNFTVACFQYNGDAFKETAIQAVGVSVNVLRDTKTESDCTRIDNGAGPIKTTRIHGTLFAYGDTDEAGGGHSEGKTEYRAFYQHVCFDVAIVVAERDMGPEDEKDEGYHPVNAREWRSIMGDLDRMLHSFAFVGPVKDGPDWEVYSDNECGEAFEYPAGATLQRRVEFSKEALNSGNIACEESFEYRGREYTLAVKLNLKDEGALSGWLTSSGYPGLEHVQLITKGNGYSEYGNRTYTYIFHPRELFIFTVSDESGTALVSEADKVFAHFLSSFSVD